MHFPFDDKYVLLYLSSFCNNADIANITVLSKYFNNVPFLYNEYITIDKISSQKAASRVEKLSVQENHQIINKYVWNQNISLIYNANENIKHYMHKFQTIKKLELHETWLVIDPKPNPVTNLYFHTNFNQVLKIGDLPNSVTHLTFGRMFDQSSLAFIPTSVTHLTFGSHYDQLLEVGTIGAHITHLNFGYWYNRPIKVGALPDSITHLTFGVSYDQTFKIGSIPANVTHLDFGMSYNQPLEVGMIPASVTHLTFGHYYNQPLKPGVIPASVTHLTIKYKFKKELENMNVFPKSIMYFLY